MEIKKLKRRKHLCEYGCGRIAKFQKRNGKWSCDKNWQACPGRKKLNLNPFCACGCGRTINGTEKNKGLIFIECHTKRGVNGYKKYIEDKEKKKLDRYINGKAMPSHEEIIRHNAKLLKDNKFKTTVTKANETCWSCGRKTTLLYRCHVIGRRHCNGNNHPENIWLLCGGCHFLQPDEYSDESGH
ncbi:MAG: hypothetical protein ABIN18_14370 [Pseudomonadota bacterium]